MPSQKKPEKSKTREFVPLILNDHVVRWYFEDGEPAIAMDIPMRHYTSLSKDKWIAQQIRIVFNRKTRSHQPYRTLKDRSEEFAYEVYYSCTNDKVTFEDKDVPVIK